MHVPPGDPRYGRHPHPAQPSPHPPGPRPTHPLAQGQPAAASYPMHPSPPAHGGALAMEPTQVMPMAPMHGMHPGAPPMQQPYSPAAPSAPPHAYASAPPHAYPSSRPQLQQPYPSPPPPAPGPGWGPHLPSLGSLGVPASLAGGLANVPQPSGLPAPVAFGLGVAACLVALVFDIIFLKVHIPGVGGYAWYLTTALSFAGAGYAGRKWTRASKGTVMVAAGVAAALYGALDLGLGLFLEDLSLPGSLVLAVQGVVIAAICGAGGVHRASRELAD